MGKKNQSLRELRHEIYLRWLACDRNSREVGRQIGRDNSAVAKYVRIVQAEDELREFVGCGAEDATMITAAAHPLPEYLSAELLFNEELDAAGAEDAIIHELLHCHLAPFTLLFEQLWDGRRKASKKQARAMLANLIEERIQRHVRQLQRARGRGGK